MILGFLEVSLGRYAEALTTLQPMLDVFDNVPGAEIMTATFIPDAAEAMIALGLHTDAEPLIKALEHHGSRLDRSWMLAVGARCRSMWLAARGDVGAAMRVAQDAMAEHAGLPMPFERAHSALAEPVAAAPTAKEDLQQHTLREALQAFERWVPRSGLTALEPSSPEPKRPPPTSRSHLPSGASPSCGIRHDKPRRRRGVFISPKTVEANLARIYRKLGIKSRAELGRVIGEVGDEWRDGIWQRHRETPDSAEAWGRLTFLTWTPLTAGVLPR